jgi:hypothetical protein
MTNYPDNVSPSSADAPWNKQRSAEDIIAERDQLVSLQIWTDKLALELAMLDDADIFSTAALSTYDCNNPADMLEAMLDIIKLRLADLAQP